MARGSQPRTGGSKIRLIVLEAELSDGDGSQFAQVLQNALQPRTAPSRTIQGRPKALGHNEAVIDEEEEEAEVQDEQVTPRITPKVVRKASFRVPQVVDVDVSTDPSLEDFTAAHPASSVVQKYMVVLAWFHEARSTSTVTVDQIYTCFKRLKWSTSAKDFAQPLRDLKGQQLVGGNSKDGFQINHVGLDRVSKFKGV